MDTKDGAQADSIEEIVAAPRALHRFMTSLLDECSVSAVQTFLIQDNTSILTKSASRSARAAHRRYLLGRDHLITKEISRWESYPFEVDKPIVVNRPKKAKNGCVPQRRFKRRSGLESAGEIKADILEKAESLPRAPRRRSSVRTDDSLLKTTELESLLEDGDDSISSASTVNSSTNNERPRRELSPRRWSTPRKPMRRLSEVPGDATVIYHNPAAAARGDLMDSQHSIASTESTLSEIAARSSDLSTVSENSDLQLAAFDSQSLECAVILEEEDEREPGEEESSPKPAPVCWFDAKAARSNSPKRNIVPKKPMRRVSEIPGDLPLEGASSHSTGEAQQEAHQELPPLSRMHSVELDDNKKDIDERPSPNHDSLKKREKRMPRKVTSAPTKMVSASPKMPMRRPSEVPGDIIHDMHHRESSSVESSKKIGEAEHSFSTESTTSETTVETLEERCPSLNCSVILEEEVSLEQDTEQELPASHSTDKEETFVSAASSSVDTDTTDFLLPRLERIGDESIGEEDNLLATQSEDSLATTATQKEPNLTAVSPLS